MHKDKFHQLKALILDMDGVLWRESEPIGDLPRIFERIESSGLDYMLATNNATRTAQQYVQKLAGFGAHVPIEKIVNSSIAVSYLLKQRFPAGGPVFIVGEMGLTEALQQAGFYHAETNCLAVIASMDRCINFEKLKRATLLVRANVPFYATNTDRTYPTPAGLIPGAGALIGALEIATDVKPIVAGKPSETLYKFALERLQTTPAETLVVGDRLETDILGAQVVGCPTSLVLSGIATRAEAEAYQPSVDIIIKDLDSLITLLNDR